MKVTLATTCGFCPGVKVAIRTAQEALAQRLNDEPVTSLGPLIHNTDEVRRLEQTYHLEGVKDLDPILLQGKTTAGVTAGASTPDRVIEALVQRLLKI